MDTALALAQSDFFTSLTDNQWKLLLAVLLIPLLGYVVQIFSHCVFKVRLPRQGDWLLTGGMFVVMCLTIYMFFVARSHGSSEVGFLAESWRDGFAFKWLYASSEKAEGLNRTQPKKIFVDVYTSWCSWCKLR